MWITTSHWLTSRAEFLAACLAAGWTRPQGQDLEAPPGVALEILGPIVSLAEVAAGDALIPGEFLDPRYNVNLAWCGREPGPAFQASLVVPETPSRGQGARHDWGRQRFDGGPRRNAARGTGD